MKVLVTGGSGFIGTNLIDSLLIKGYTILNLDIEPPVKECQLTYHKHCDIRVYETLYNHVRDFSPDFIVHLAARTDLDGKCLSDYDSNTLGLKNLCEVIANVPGIKKTLFASSMLVCNAGYIPKDIYDFTPNTCYGKSKAKGELIVRENSDDLGDFLIFRPTSIWGPWFKEPYRNYFDMVLNKKFFDVDGEFSRKTYGFVYNSINQIESLMRSDIDLRNELIYIGDSQPIEISSWASIIASQANLRPPIKLPMWVFKVASLIGDTLKIFGIHFPLTSFRLNNMLTDNVINCDVATSLNKYEEVEITEATITTLKWINQHEK